MTRVTRRDFLRSASIGLGLAGCASTVKGDIAPKSGRRVVVIGGGWGGATAARYVRMTDPSIEVVLLEPNREFVSCPFSNLVLSGLRSIESLTRSYDGLRGRGVQIMNEAATAIEPDTKRVRIGDGYLAYDRLVVSPGIDFQWEQIEGLPAAKDTVLHAWKAGPQTAELARQIAAMSDGGVFVLTVPPVAYRCPPGPYERTCQVAWYLKTNKPRAKIIVLDANQNVVSKTGLFREAWKAYPNLDYRASSKVIAVDPGARTVRTEFDTVKYDVLNLIPPQRAGGIAPRRGGWARKARVDLPDDDRPAEDAEVVHHPAVVNVSACQAVERSRNDQGDGTHRGHEASGSASSRPPVRRTPPMRCATRGA
jgi:NADPH-dependent 2,4-dienoyl-CoA reductase/sulfur reductase-like enzyme